MNDVKEDKCLEHEQTAHVDGYVLGRFEAGAAVREDRTEQRAE